MSGIPVLAISNAKSRSVSKQGSGIDLSYLPEGSQHHISQDTEDLPPLIQQAKRNNVQHILIEGGDGTVRTMMTVLLNSYDKTERLPAVSILPSGTTNQIARNIGLRKIDDMRRISAAKIKKTTVPLVKIQLKVQNKTITNPVYGFLFSTGALPHVSRFAQDKLNRRGIGGGTAVIGAFAKAITGDKSELMPPSKHRIRAKLNNQTIFKHKGPALGTVMTTLPSLMLGLDPFWGQEKGPLRLTWASADSQKLGRNIAGLWMGRKHDRAQDGFYSHNIDRLNLRTKAPLALDGDFLDLKGQKLRISVSRPVTFWQAR